MHVQMTEVAATPLQPLSIKLQQKPAGQVVADVRARD